METIEKTKQVIETMKDIEKFFCDGICGNGIDCDKKADCVLAFANIAMNIINRESR